ncbi:MAG: hypothetical protein ACRDZO_17750 [Egibacteraceae bacterium]
MVFHEVLDTAKPLAVPRDALLHRDGEDRLERLQDGIEFAKVQPGGGKVNVREALVDVRALLIWTALPEPDGAL